VSYKEFKEANAEVDQAFIASVHKLVAAKGTPVTVAIAGLRRLARRKSSRVCAVHWSRLAEKSLPLRWITF